MQLVFLGFPFTDPLPSPSSSLIIFLLHSRYSSHLSKDISIEMNYHQQDRYTDVSLHTTNTLLAIYFFSTTIMRKLKETVTSQNHFQALPALLISKIFWTKKTGRNSIPLFEKCCLTVILSSIFF